MPRALIHVWYERKCRWVKGCPSHEYTVIIFLSFFFSSFLLSLNPRLFVQSFFDMHASYVPMSASLFFLGYLEMSLIPSTMYVPLPFVSFWYGESYVVLHRFSLPGGVFLSCDHELDFNIRLYYVIIKKNNQEV